MKNYHIKYLLREIEKFSKIYKRFKSESIVMFNYNDNELCLKFDCDYPTIKIELNNINNYNRMIKMVINDLKRKYHINHVRYYDNGKVCNFNISW